MRILLTGANGFIGRRLLHALLAQGHEVVCATRTPPPADASGLSPAWIRADFAHDTDKSAWLARLAGIDAVVNAVGIFREQGSQTFEHLHVRAPQALFAACADTPGVRLVVQLSALGADDGAATRYHRSKKAADDCLAALPLRAVVVQPSLVYGPGGASARAFKALATLPFALRLGDAPQLVQPVHVDDLVDAILALLPRAASEHAAVPQVDYLALVGPQALSFVDYLAALRAALGLGRLRVLPLPNGAARLLARLGGLLPGSLLDPEALRMLERGNSADPAPVARLLGRPLRPVSSFVAVPDAERARAQLDWLLPVLRTSIVLVWLLTALVSAFLYPVDASYDLLGRSGIPPALQPAMLYGAAAFDLLLGIGILVLKRRRPLWLAQLALVGFYTVFIAVKLPEFLLHPYGPLLKNLPILAVLWLLFELEEERK